MTQLTSARTRSGAIAAMAMTGMRVVTVGLNLLPKDPPGRRPPATSLAPTDVVRLIGG